MMREISRTGKAGRAPKRSAGTHPNRDAIDMGRLGKWAWARFARRASRAPRRRRPRATSCLMITLTRSSSDPRCARRSASKHAIHHVQGGRSSIHRGASQGPQNAKHAAQWDDHRDLSWTKVLVRNIDAGHVHRVLEPTCTAKARDRPQSGWTHREIFGWAQLALSDKKPMAHNSGCDRSAIGGLRFASWALRKKKLTSCHAKNDREGISRHCL